MKRYALFLLFVGLTVGLIGAALAQVVIPAGVPSLTLVNVCAGTTAKVWRTKAGDIWIGCGNAVPPAGSVELRAFYVVPSGGPKK